MQNASSFSTVSCFIKIFYISRVSTFSSDYSSTTFSTKSRNDKSGRHLKTTTSQNSVLQAQHQILFYVTENKRFRSLNLGWSHIRCLCLTNEPPSLGVIIITNSKSINQCSDPGPQHTFITLLVLCRQTPAAAAFSIEICSKMLAYNTHTLSTFLCLQIDEINRWMHAAVYHKVRNKLMLFVSSWDEKASPKGLMKATSNRTKDGKE